MNLWRNAAVFHERLSRRQLIIEAIALVVGIGIIDYLTGYELSFFPFYSIPILLLVGFDNSRAAIVISILSALAWWCADTASGHIYSNEWLRIWDTTVRLMFFCLVVVAGTGFRRNRDADRARIALLERSRSLEEEIINISEREQQRIGRDLHDELGQRLVALGFAADALKSELEFESPRGARAAEQISDQLHTAIIRARNLARGLSPVDQDDGGLESALEQLANSTSRLSGISCSFICDGPVVIPDNTHAVHLYRIAQEALNNAMKHGRAKEVVIALEATECGLSLRVSDDGGGIDSSSTEPKGMGQSIMRYRARIIGATLAIQPNLPNGTVMTCTISEPACAPSNPTTYE
ncbi:MAG: sensor histidine kinase [Verrucomicrobiota bacterium]